MHPAWLSSPKFLLLLLGLIASTTVNAGWFGSGGDSWKEEVLLHDGQKIIVKRSLSYGGRHEIGQSEPIKEQTISFQLPGSNKGIAWTSEYSEDIGRSNFNLLALHILNGTPYVVASPNLCLSYNKWDRPNPPYVFFKHDGKAWQRIPVTEFPAEFKEINVVIVVGDYDFTEARKKSAVISAAAVKKMNSELTQPEYKTILRKPFTKEGLEQKCEERVLYKGSWILPNDPVARKFIDQQKK